MMASALRHHEFLVALTEQGVEDYRRDPDATLAAYHRLSRNVVAVLDLPRAD
jgi:hypothetical protein